MEQLLKTCEVKSKSRHEVLTACEALPVQAEDFPLSIWIHLTEKGPVQPFLMFPENLKVVCGWDQLGILFAEKGLLTLEELSQVLSSYSLFERSALAESLYRFSPLETQFVTDLAVHWGNSIEQYAHPRAEVRSFEQLIEAWRER